MWISVDRWQQCVTTIPSTATNCRQIAMFDYMSCIGWSNISFIEPYWVVSSVSLLLLDRLVVDLFLAMPKWQKRDNVFVSTIMNERKNNSNTDEIYAHSNVVFNSSSYSHMDGSNDWLAGKSRANHTHRERERHVNVHQMYRNWKWRGKGIENLKHPKRKYI